MRLNSHRKTLFMVKNKVQIQFCNHWYDIGFNWEVVQEMKLEDGTVTSYWIRSCGLEDGWYNVEYFIQPKKPFVFR
jgi:hypothetical protein